jgi:hypothetical protein
MTDYKRLVALGTKIRKSWAKLKKNEDRWSIKGQNTQIRNQGLK